MDEADEKTDLTADITLCSEWSVTRNFPRTVPFFSLANEQSPS